MKSAGQLLREHGGRHGCRPHDLIRVNGADALQSAAPLPDWVGDAWHPGLPLVVRRDFSADGLIPAGIRGNTRAERAAVWVAPDSVIETVTPEALVDDAGKLAASPFAGTRPVQALLRLVRQAIPWRWGVTGSCGYALATGKAVMHADSDLDILVRCPEPVKPADFAGLAGIMASLPCRTDVQIETPAGAFALKEWLRECRNNPRGRILLKTDFGPVLTDDPWQPE